MGDGDARKVWRSRAAAVVVAAAVAAAVVLAGLYARSPRATRIGVGERAPEFDLVRLMDGGRGPFRTAGGPTLLVFIDTKSPGAARYLRAVEERIYRRNLRRGLRVVGVVTDADTAAARAFASSIPLTFYLLSDPDARTVSALYGTPRDPEAYLIDPSGRVEAVFTERLDPGDAALRERLERHLHPAPHGF